MSCTTLIRKSEDNYKLSRKLVETLSTKFNFTLEDGWSAVCDSSMSKLDSKFRKERRRADPYSSVKKPRTAFSFYTKDRRAQIQSDNPKASFGEISKIVAQKWRALSDKELSKYTKMETEDKERYSKERNVVSAQLEQASTTKLTTEQTTEPTTETPVVEQPVVEETPKKKARTKSGKSSKSSSKSGKSKSSGKATESTQVPVEKTTEVSKSSVKSGYSAFQKKMRPSIKKENSGANTKQLNSLLKNAWESLTDAEKETYA